MQLKGKKKILNTRRSKRETEANKVKTVPEGAGMILSFFGIFHLLKLVKRI